MALTVVSLHLNAGTLTYNTDYKFLEAHLDGKNELPVNMVRISSRGTIKVEETPRTIDRVDAELGRAHDLHGWDQHPPYMIHRADGAYPVYWNPRWVVAMK
ncbi:unnamed protein product [Clonostachys rosea f. rosea IK726]|jgi:hypothetical protein|uniref:Uncharacterized protein n=2 Tax=Bionectria ochroleuca TaxID=29856 RepID=A0A0B7JTM4_BIOOC|nr:unnamed protein product [Clonostachys rosea f. rosea IK726]